MESADPMLCPSFALYVGEADQAYALAWQVNVRPSVFAYAAPLTAEAATEVKKVEKAVLSTTARAKAKAKEKQAGKAAASDGAPQDAPCRP